MSAMVADIPTLEPPATRRIQSARFWNPGKQDVYLTLDQINRNPYHSASPSSEHRVAQSAYLWRSALRPSASRIQRLYTECITGRSACLHYRPASDSWKRIFGVRRGITSGGQAALVTLGYLGVGHQPPEVAIPGRAGRAESWASASPTETPQVRDTAAGPHRNPTDETAHSGTLVMRVKGTENSRSAALMRVSWAVGTFSR